MGGRYTKMAQFLEHICRTYAINICIKDFTGFIPIDRELDQALLPYWGHTNPFCMYIKADQRQLSCCLSTFRAMAIKCGQGKPYFAMCHAGVGQYVVPIKTDDIVLGAILAGYFNYRPELSRYMIKRNSRVSAKIEYETACDLFDRHIVNADVNLEEMFIFLEMAAEYLAATYAHLKDIHSKEKLPSRKSSSHEDTIVAHALEYIRRNFASQILVKDLAAHCYCSESYINHSFKKRVGLNINTYINKVRVENAKNRLITTQDTMTAIAMDLGFNDPNYFTRVFHRLVGNRPSDFRRRYS